MSAYIIVVKMKSSLHLSTNTPLHKQQLTKVKTIWRSLQDHNDSIQFRNPVNYKAMGLYDYPQYIKYPMDLSTIHRKLREQRYRTVQEVLDDFQMIWDNCRAYNPPNSWIHNLAERLEKAFKKMVKSYLPAISNAILVAKENVEVKKEEESEPIEQEVSFHLKLQFVDKLRLISPPSMQLLVEHISQVAPKAFTENEGKAQILVDLLDVQSFRSVSEKLQEILLTDKASSKKIKLY